MEVSKWRERGSSGGQSLFPYSTFRNVIGLSISVAREAAKWSLEFKLATAEAIIYSTAR